VPRSRETIEERRARLQPGAQWLLQQRKARGWSGRELGEKLGIAQERVSAYERAQDEPRPAARAAFASRLAEVFEMDEVDVWRGLCWPLPAPFRTDEEAVADLEHRRPGFIEHVLASLEPGAKQQPPAVKRRGVTRKGDPPISESQARTNAV
jgi:transcriptional regulator with XRE-family HTH domain